MQKQEVATSLHAEPLRPYLFLRADLRDKAAGGAHSGSPQAAVMAGLNMSHSGIQRFSPSFPATLQARQGQQKKP